MCDYCNFDDVKTKLLGKQGNYLYLKKLGKYGVYLVISSKISGGVPFEMLEISYCPWCGKEFPNYYEHALEHLHLTNVVRVKKFIARRLRRLSFILRDFVWRYT